MRWPVLTGVRALDRPFVAGVCLYPAAWVLCPPLAVAWTAAGVAVGVALLARWSP